MTRSLLMRKKTLQRFFMFIPSCTHVKCLQVSSTKTNKGPLKAGWKEDTKPLMCCYKLVTVKAKVWGLQGKLEDFIMKSGKKQFHMDSRYCLLTSSLQKETSFFGFTNRSFAGWMIGMDCPWKRSKKWNKNFLQK